MPVSNVHQCAPRGHLPRRVPIQGSGTLRDCGRARLVRRESHDARGNRLTAGGARSPSLCAPWATTGPGGDRGQILDYGNGAYEASYVTRVAGPTRRHWCWVPRSWLKGHCEAGRAVVSGCILRVAPCWTSSWRQGSIFHRATRRLRQPHSESTGTVGAAMLGGWTGHRTCTSWTARRDVATWWPPPMWRDDIFSPSSEGTIRSRARVSVRARRLPRRGRRPRLRHVRVRHPARLAGLRRPRPGGGRRDHTHRGAARLVRQPDCFRTRRRVSVSAAEDPARSRLRSKTAADRGRRRQRAARSTPRGRTSPRRLATTLGRVPSHLADCPGATDPRRVLFGEALTGVDCGQVFLTMHAADRSETSARRAAT